MDALGFAGGSEGVDSHLLVELNVLDGGAPVAKKPCPGCPAIHPVAVAKNSPKLGVSNVLERLIHLV